MENEPTLMETLASWAETTQANTELRLARGMLLATLRTRKIFSTFSGWLLAISGGTIGLAFSNLESVQRALTSGELKLILSLLVVSGLLGFVAKVFDALVEINVQSISEGEKVTKQILDEHSQVADEIDDAAGELAETVSLYPDFQRAVAQYLECVPSWFRKRIEKTLAKAEGDPLFAYKRATRLYFSSTTLVSAQVVFFALFGVVLFCVA